MKSFRGFTLIELLTVLSILGIISAFGIPSLYRFIENQRSISTSYELYHYLNFARTEAITRNKVVAVCASINQINCSRTKDWSNQYILIFLDQNQDGNRNEGEHILRIKNFNMTPGSLTWRSFRNKSYLQWLPSGMTYYQNGNFTYCPPNKNPRYAKNIIMNAAGRMYFGLDNTQDGIPEGSNGKNVSC